MSASSTPVIRAEDIKFYLSGGAFNTDPNNSIGGEMSMTELNSTGLLNGLFDRINEHEMLAGDTEYRCIYIKNTHQDRALLGCKVWLEVSTTSNTTGINLAVGPGGTNGSEVLIPNESYRPPTVALFEAILEEPEQPNIGDLGPGDYIALWILYYVDPNTLPLSIDEAVIRLDGEREPEATSGLPPPSPPPTITCPTGYHWAPAQQVCIPNNVAIVCPLGHHYDEATQRCVPDSTPPPTVKDLKIAAVGDLDEVDTFTNIAANIPIVIPTGGNADDLGFFLALGDNDYPDANSNWFIGHCRDDLDALFPDRIAPNIGNHDDEEDGSANKRNQLVNTFPLLPPEGYYAFTVRNIRIIVLDTQTNINPNSTQYNFAVTQIQQAAGNPSIRWIIVHYHKPSLVSTSDYEPITAIRDNLHAVYDQYGVDIIMNGHNHNYFRSFPVKDNPSNHNSPTPQSTSVNGPYDRNTINGRIFMTIGTGGRANDEFEDDPEPFVAARTADFGVMFITLQNNGQELLLQWRNNSSGNPVEDSCLLTKHVGGPAPAPQCPVGYHWDQVVGVCMPDTSPPIVCPIGYHIEGSICVPDVGTPPDPNAIYPVSGVQWSYDAAPILATAQTINANAHSSDGVILVSNDGAVTSMTISGGFINIPVGTTPAGEGKIYLDYHTRPLYTSLTNQQHGYNTVITFQFERTAGQDNVSVKDGNHGATGFAFDGDLVFGGFGFSLHATEIQSNVEYYHNIQGPTSTVPYPSGKTLVAGQMYRVFATLRTDVVANRQVLNVWMIFGTETVWTKILHDRSWTMTDWNPGTVPAGDDRTAILNGPSFIKRHHYWIRNNSPAAQPALKVKDIKVGTLPFLTGNSPPGGPGPDPPPGGGTVDSLGIRWLEATGEQGMIEQSRDDPDDFRWSGNVTNVQNGYEITTIATFVPGGVASDGHFALKHWGPNHSGDCGHQESGECCCWYDTGIRANGAVQTQIERPHPNNDDFPCPACTMSNVGTVMNGHTIGMKWLVHPTAPGQNTDNGGSIRLKMWVDTDALGTDGRPRNNWVLVYDMTDTGQILDNYPAPSEQDLENRISGINDLDDIDVYGGGLHWRKYIFPT